MAKELSLLGWANAMAAFNAAGVREYSPFVCHVMNTLDPRARMSCECCWISPFGWVPEAGCPEHDPDN